MARRERVVEFAVKARDEFSKTLKNLERQQERISAAAKAANRRNLINVGNENIAAAIANYKQLSSEVERYRAVQANAARTGALSASEMRELGDTIKLVRDRAREAVDTIQQNRAALDLLSASASKGFKAFVQNADAMQRSASAALSVAAAEQKAAASAQKKLEVQARSTSAAKSGFAAWSQYATTITRIAAEESRAAAVAQRKADAQSRLTAQAKSGFAAWSRYVDVAERVRAEEARAVLVSQRRAEVQNRLAASANSGFVAWSKYADTISRIAATEAKSTAVAQRKADIQARLNAETKSGFAAFSRMATELEVGAAATGQWNAAGTVQIARLNKLTSATNTAAAAQSNLADQTRKSSAASGKGNAQNVSAFGLKPWQLTNLGYQVNDVVSGLAMGQKPMQVFAQQIGQIIQIWPEMMSGLATKLPIIAGAGAAFAPLIAALVEVNARANALRDFTDRLNSLANGANYSAEALSKVTRNFAELAPLVNAGISQDQIKSFYDLGKSLSRANGEDLSANIGKLAAAFGGGVAGVRALDKELQFLTADQYANLVAMEKSGKQSEAMGEAHRILEARYASFSDKAKGPWAQAWSALGKIWKNSINWLADSAAIKATAAALNKLGEAVAFVVKGLAEGENLTPQQTLARYEKQLSETISRRDSTPIGRQRAGYTKTIDELKKKVGELRAEVEKLEGAEKNVTARSEEQRKVRQDIFDTINRSMGEELSMAKLSERQRFVENKVLEAKNQLLAQGLSYTDEELSKLSEIKKIREDAAALFDQNKYYGATSFVDKVVGAESSGNPNAVPVDENGKKKSSAVGLGQFIEGTWLRMFKQYFPDRAAGLSDAMILAMRKDGETSRAMVELYARENAKLLETAGVAVSDATLYLAHFLGPQGAIAVLTANANKPVEELLSANQINANKSVLAGKTAGDVINFAQGKMGATDQEYALRGKMIEQEQEYTKSYQERLDQQKFELEMMSKTAREAAIAKALRDEELKAKEAGLALTVEQRAETERLAAAEFDRQNVNLEVNRLMEQRQGLMDRVALAIESGDQGMLSQAQSELTTINGQLNQAIDQAIAFWQAMGGEGAAAAILNLQNMKIEVESTVSKMQNQFLPTAESLNEQIADIGSTAFSSLAQAIANGENAADAFFSSLLQGISDFLVDIGKAIVKQALFNALIGPSGNTSGGAGGSILGAIGSLFGAKHSGGIVGQTTQTRKVNPLVFAGAQRYHSGGIVGLRSGERPIVALDGEEVLTENDPRHIRNGGGSQAVNIKNVNVFRAEDVLENALASVAGERILMNFMSRNSNKLNGVLAK